MTNLKIGGLRVQKSECGLNESWGLVGVILRGKDVKSHGENAYKRHTFVVRRQPLGCGETRDVREENCGGESQDSLVMSVNNLNTGVHGENNTTFKVPVGWQSQTEDRPKLSLRPAAEHSSLL